MRERANSLYSSVKFMSECVGLKPTAVLLSVVCQKGRVCYLVSLGHVFIPLSYLMSSKAPNLHHMMQGERKHEIIKNIWEICLEFIPQTNLI